MEQSRRAFTSYFAMLISIVIVCLMAATVTAKESSDFADKVAIEHELSPQAAAQLKKILTQTPGITRNIGTEDPNVLQGPNNSWHPATRQQCVDRVLRTGLISRNPTFERICGAKWMAPVADFPGQPPEQAHLCIDQFSFPDMPCEYPMVWTPAPVTKAICESMGKRVCNSHEWEGACAGSIDNNNPYRFDLPSLDARRSLYNQSRQVIWAFQWQTPLRGLHNSGQVCGIFSASDPDITLPMRANISAYYSSIGKSLRCQAAGSSDYDSCGSNTWPTGFKRDCRTERDVFDMHGNVAEVVNFPTSMAGLAHADVTDRTERKGSFFVVRTEYPDDCRVRQPYEHFNNFATDGMAYYQEGFRCCKEIK